MSHWTPPTELTIPSLDPVAAAAPKDFAAIAQQYGDFVYNVALRMTGDSHEAQDAAQDAFISAYRAFGRFRGESAISTWLYRITVNAVLMRRRKRKQERATPSVPLEGQVIRDPSGGPEKAAINSELKDAIQLALNQLPPDQRMAVILRDVQGLSGEEAAAALNIPNSTLKTRLHRARLRLRDLLARYVETPE